MAQSDGAEVVKLDEGNAVGMGTHDDVLFAPSGVGNLERYRPAQFRGRNAPAEVELLPCPACDGQVEPLRPGAGERIEHG